MSTATKKTIETKRTGLLALLLIAAAAAAMALAPTASAATEWKLEIHHGPERISPGQPAQYVIYPYNIGDTASKGACPGVDCVTITATLPPKVEATATRVVPNVDLFSVEEGGELLVNDWECSGATVVTCTLSGANSLQPVGPPWFQSGQAPPIVISVDVAGDVAGTLEAGVEISGGGGAPFALSHPAPVSETPAGFGIRTGSFLADAFDGPGDAATPERQAGSHPAELRTEFDLNMRYESDPLRGGPMIEPERQLRNTTVRLPRGLLGNPRAVPACELTLFAQSPSGSTTMCPPDSQVGIASVIVNQGNENSSQFSRVPIYNLEPPPGALALFGFSFSGVSARVVAALDPTDYSVLASVHDASTLMPVATVRTRFWGVPAHPSHEALRADPAGGGVTDFDTPSTAPVEPFLTMPSQCDSGDAFDIDVDSWQTPVATDSASSDPVTMEGCEKQSFGATATAAVSTSRADSPAALDFELKIPQDEQPTGLGTPPLREAVVTLPEGVTVNPSSAGGLGSCSPSQIGLGTNDPISCPPSSKIGSLDLETPVLEENVKGSVYLAKPFDNPFDSLIALYFVLEDKERGLLVKLPAEVSVDPTTGQIETTVKESPQLPFESFRVELKQGPRAALRTPERCGTYTTTAELTAWNSQIPVVNATSSFAITRGPSGSCPTGEFDPDLEAGTTSPIAGDYSPFALRLQRRDGTQQLAGITATLPEGLLGKLAGVSICSQAQIDAAKAMGATGLGAGELSSPTCPATSQVGTATVGAGAGPNPFYTGGKAYLSGPYKGAPLSLAIVTPAVAGPFDLGKVVVQAALRVDERTTQITAQSDPLPTILHGIPLDLRDVRVDADRFQFTLNPTSCDPMAIEAEASSPQGATAALSERFQVGACRALDFKPRLSLRLKGATKRGKNPRLIATLKARGGDANIGRAQVTLPRAAFLDQEHIDTVCTRVQFAADNCPKGSVYGKAIAKTPLLDQPLTGPVYLRSSSNRLPDLVAALKGPAQTPIEVELSGRTDSVKGALRNTFDFVPDAPVASFRLELFGGKRGLVENSRNFCRGTHRATVKLDGQNGKVSDARPAVKASCKKR